MFEIARIPFRRLITPNVRRDHVHTGFDLRQSGFLALAGRRRN
jgi:hypothetical protein